MRIYLASRYSRRDELRLVRARLVEMGHQVVSSWLDTAWEERDELGGSSAAPPEYRAQHAVWDMDDVLRADCLIAFTAPPRCGGRGGCHVEFGIALGRGHRMIVVGHRENLFHHHPSVEFYTALDDLLAVLPRGVQPGEGMR